ncbi:MAG: DUF3037 domain-containing protein [Rhodospirillaceae bacterium]|nr:DUF3037 domain-containing protein [Rhodospirillaceae bacterium]
MSGKIPYSYTILRYVHDPVTGEFVNVGVLMHLPELRKVQIKTRTSIGRLRGAFPDLDRDAFNSAMRSIKSGVSAVSRRLAENNMFESDRHAGDLARLALATDDSSLQWSNPGGGYTNSPEATLQRLFARYVSKYDTHAKSRKTEEDVWRPVREKIAERKLPIEFEELEVVGAADTIQFGNAWKNGKWHAYEPISFDLADANGIKDKARRWRGHLDAAADGADATGVSLHLLVGKPQTAALLPAYEQAVEILRTSEFKPAIYDEAQVDTLVNEMEDEVRAHAASGA